MMERRKSQRLRTRFPAVVLDRETGDFIGRIANISTEGIMLLTEEPLDVNTLFHFRLELPDEIMDRTELLFDARSLWCNRGPNPAYHRTGLELVGLTAEDEAIIELLIRDYVFQRMVS